MLNYQYGFSEIECKIFLNAANMMEFIKETKLHQPKGWNIQERRQELKQKSGMHTSAEFRKGLKGSTDGLT